MYAWLRTLARRDESEGALGRHSVLLATLVFLLLALPIVGKMLDQVPSFSVLLGLVLVAAIFVNLRQRNLFWLSVAVGVPAIAGSVAMAFFDALPLSISTNALALTLMSLTTIILLNSLLQSDHVSPDTLVGGICVYLLIGLCFAVAFVILIELVPGALVYGDDAIVRQAAYPSAHATRLLYFSFVTLTTLGYGDVTPVHDVAQMLAVAEAETGQLYLTILVARLVGLYVGARRRIGAG